jgi:hypothetical protein
VYPLWPSHEDSRRPDADTYTANGNAAFWEENMTALEQTLTRITELADALDRRAASSTPKTIQEWQRYRKDTYMLARQARDFVTAASCTSRDATHTLIHAQQAIQDLEEALQGLPGGLQA